MSAPGSAESADKTASKGVARDFDEVVIADFEEGPAQERPGTEKGINIEVDCPKATRGRGCLRIDLTRDKPIRISFRIPSDAAVNHEWLEYDVVGAPTDGVLIDTVLSEDTPRRRLAYTTSVVDGSPWLGQLLLSEWVGGRVDRDLRVDLQLTALGSKASVYFDALRVVRDRPPKLPDDLGGAYAFCQPPSAPWPGFDAVGPRSLGRNDGRWSWRGAAPPQVSSLCWPDPLTRTLVGAGPVGAPDMSFTLNLRLRPGSYEGVIFAAPITQQGLRRARFSLSCNGRELIGRDWRPERMATEEGIFAGRSLRKLTAEAVRRLWVDQTFVGTPINCNTKSGPRAQMSRARLMAQIAARAGLCTRQTGWLDFSGVTSDKEWRGQPSEGFLRTVGQAAGQVRSELRRMDIKATALVADGIALPAQFEQSPRRGMMHLARLLREAGWTDVGVFLGQGRSDGGDAPAERVGPRSGDEELEMLVRELDRVVAPAALADHLHRRWPRLNVELYDPTAGRFSAGFGLWLSGLSGLWTIRAHRPTAPYQPFDYPSPADWPLLMPFPGRPAPTLRLLALREGRIDYAYVILLEDLIKNTRSAPQVAEKARSVLETARRELLSGSQEVAPTTQEAGQERLPSQSHLIFRQPYPSSALMDKHRRAIFEQIVELTQAR
jgi:hypothetical protein